MVPLSTYYDKKFVNGCSTIQAVAFSRPATVETAVNVFFKTGISPYNPDTFPDNLFAPSLTTDHSMPDVQSLTTFNQIKNFKLCASEQCDHNYNSRPAINFNRGQRLRTNLLSKDLTQKKGIDKRKGKTAVITSSPYKTELEQDENKTTSGFENGIKSSNKSRKFPADNKNGMASSYEDEDEREEACIVCNALYLDSKGGENWTQCSGCKAWAHDTFAKAEEDADTSLCDVCVVL
ncbi:hypothetical protein J6590_089368 [Homalodisca vitripennis]|nr:hypothetical protein J6590_089368 [Homalodisca vitripennis]